MRSVLPALLKSVTPLHAAVSQQRADIVELLLKAMTARIDPMTALIDPKGTARRPFGKG